MNRQVFSHVVRSAMLVSLTLAQTMAQAPPNPPTRGEARPSIARTPWGDPDLQGTWDFTTITSLERPPGVRWTRVPHRGRGGGARETRQSAAIRDRVQVSGIVERGRPARVRSRYLQPGLVVGTGRAETGSDEENIDRRRSAGWSTSSTDATSAGDPARARGRSRAQPWSGGSAAGRTLHPGVQLGSADGSRTLQQSDSGLSRTRLRGDRQRDGARRAHRLA